MSHQFQYRPPTDPVVDSFLPCSPFFPSSSQPICCSRFLPKAQPLTTWPFPNVTYFFLVFLFEILRFPILAVDAHNSIFPNKIF